LLKIIRYLGANVGNLSTTKSIADYLASTGRRISADTVDNYLTLLEEAYLFYRVKREDLRGKSVMKTSDKFFIVDLGFRTVSQGLGVSDIGHLLENVVYFELSRRHGKVSVGKYKAEEVDFVTFTPGQGLAYFQVCLTMADPATRDRELRPLLALRDAYPKTVLSLDEIRQPDYEGIQHKNLIDWLLGRDS
jgi:predicted AAA+ superfamily ATPase